MYSRPSFDEMWLEVAQVISKRGTCDRRRVGAVLTDINGVCLSTGYNGTARQADHCIVSPCGGARLPSGTGLDKCEAIHAEQNALIQCKEPQNIHTCYTTVSPCIHCVKMLLNTSCQRIVFSELYPHPDAMRLWEGAAREWIWISNER